MEAKTMQELKNLITGTLLDITISNPEKTEELTKIKIRQMDLKVRYNIRLRSLPKPRPFIKTLPWKN